MGGVPGLAEHAVDDGSSGADSKRVDVEGHGKKHVALEKQDVAARRVPGIVTVLPQNGPRTGACIGEGDLRATVGEGNRVKDQIGPGDRLRMGVRKLAGFAVRRGDLDDLAADRGDLGDAELGNDDDLVVCAPRRSPEVRHAGDRYRIAASAADLAELPVGEEAQPLTTG